MNFWKSLAIGLAALLGISYAGFAYIYSSSGGIIIAGMITGGMQSKVITLLRNSNITSAWTMSVSIQGYKTGSLYCQMASAKPGGGLAPECQFELDSILGRKFELTAFYTRAPRSWEIDLEGTKMWIRFNPTIDPEYTEAGAPQSAVVSMSLYLRD